jgi:mannose-1-phosphate guanylyltransferase
MLNFNDRSIRHPVVQCGGAGMRLWLVSREEMPKHFVPLIGSLTPSSRCSTG